jgi:hypothetical protein
VIEAVRTQAFLARMTTNLVRRRPRHQTLD